MDLLLIFEENVFCIDLSLQSTPEHVKTKILPLCQFPRTFYLYKDINNYIKQLVLFYTKMV